MMTLAEFEEFLLTHGSDLENWPEDLSGRAASLLAQDRSARVLVEEFEKFETTLLSAAKVESRGAALTGQILKRLSARDGNGLRDYIAPGAIAAKPGILSAFGGAFALTMLGLGFFAGSLDLIWLDGINASEFSQLLFGEPQDLMETL